MIAFGLLALIAVLSALLVVGTRNPVVSALWLALTFVAVAGLFIVLGAEFLAAIQIIVYAGAILVFFLFVIMLLNLSKLPPAAEGEIQRWLGLWLAAAIGILAAFAIRASEIPASSGAGPVGDPQHVGNTAALAILLYRDYIYPFEIASVLLTAAVVGAVVLARKRV